VRIAFKRLRGLGQHAPKRHAFGNRFCLLHRTDHHFSHAARGLWAIVMNTLCRLVCSARQGEGLFSSGALALCPAWASPQARSRNILRWSAFISAALERLSSGAVLSDDSVSGLQGWLGGRTISD
jgi:hypothetical protein